MALVLKDRVRETSTTSGTGTIVLAGAVAGFQTFSAIGNTTKAVVLKMMSKRSAAKDVGTAASMVYGISVVKISLTSYCDPVYLSFT